eukprot:jgi/Undpi1/8877/HiC_scaffold_25.g11339.m1
MAAKALLEAGAYVEARFGGYTPLHYACGHCSDRVAPLLLFWGAGENAADLKDGAATSEIVGSSITWSDEELEPREFAHMQLLEGIILLTTLNKAPADRRWRCRGCLAVCRARWLTRIGEGKERSTAVLGYIPENAADAKKCRGGMPSSALVGNPTELSFDRGKSHGRDEAEQALAGGKHLPEAAAPIETVLRVCNTEHFERWRCWTGDWGCEAGRETALCDSSVAAAAVARGFYFPGDCDLFVTTS